MAYELSYWEQESFLNGIDVAVLGSGIVGLSAAIHLKKLHPKQRIVVLERSAIPAGASTRNAGFACFGSMTELLDDLEHMSEDDLLTVVEKRWTGLQRLRALVGDENMAFESLGGYELFGPEETSIFKQCVERLPEFNAKIGKITGHSPVYRTADEQIASFGFAGVEHLILNQAEGQIHTGKMMHRLLLMARQSGVEIFNGIGICDLEDTNQGVLLETEMGWTLKADRVVVAMNGFAKKLLPALDLYPARNQVLLTKPIPGLKIKGCFHYDRGYFYFRNIDGRILLGGGRNLDLEGEKTSDFGAHQEIRVALENLLRDLVCPDQEPVIDQWWSGIMGLGPVKKPILEKHSERVVLAVRLSGMGVAIGTLIGQDAAELIS